MHHRHSLTLIAVALVLSGSHGGLRAQQNEQETVAHTTGLHLGASALQFQIGSNFTLQSFQGAVLSLKHHYWENGALRLGLGLSLSDNDSESDGTTLEMDTAFSASRAAQSTNSHTVQIMVQYLYYADPRASVNFFIGGGPLLQFSGSHGDRQSAGEGINYTTVESTVTDRTAWAAGATALAGVEWFASRSIALHAEYGLSLQYAHESTSGHTTYEYRGLPPYHRANDAETSQHSWQIAATSVKFGLSVYF